MKRAGIVCILFSAVLVSAVLIFSCGGGGGGNGGPVERLAFHTSTTGNADLSSWAEVSGTGLTGLEAADAICNARAEAAGLDGTFVAWISDDNDDAYCRANGLTGKKGSNCGQGAQPVDAGPWFRTDGSPFAGRIDELADLMVQYTPLLFDEFGSTIDIDRSYWTGTNVDGTVYETNCSNWTDSTVTGSTVVAGVVFGTGLRWTRGNTPSVCSLEKSLACLQLGTDNVEPNPQAEGKTVFISSANGSGNLGSWPEAGGSTGIAAGDAICQNLAAAAGLASAGSFKAWLSDSATDGADRLTSDGPWVRVDGMMVAESKTALINSALLTSIDVTEDGVYRGGAAVYTGTSGTGSRTASLCADWSDGTGSSNATYGNSNVIATALWTEAGSLPCSNLVYIYCFED